MVHFYVCLGGGWRALLQYIRRQIQPKVKVVVVAIVVAVAEAAVAAAAAVVVLKGALCA